MRLKASIVGSSWNRADRSGVAPIRSPADTKTVLRGFVARRFLMCVARYSTPPAGTQVCGTIVGSQVWVDGAGGTGAGPCREPIRPPELASGFTTSSCPWKSFRPRIWMSTGLRWLGPPAAVGAASVRSSIRDAASANAARNLGDRVTRSLLVRVRADARRGAPCYPRRLRQETGQYAQRRVKFCHGVAAAHRRHAGRKAQRS